MHLMPANRRAAHLHLQTLALPHPPAHTHVCMRTYACAHPTITPSPPPYSLIHTPPNPSTHTQPPTHTPMTNLTPPACLP